ncbi:MAG: MFS transporter [Gammaproteobacteria bacterium]|nr:MFS transporter [Gammaproteobacteria bacterium]
MHRDFILYLLVIGFASLATGIQLVLIPWLATGQLGLSGEQVGWVQAANLIPGALLLLWSGAFADRRGSAGYLPWIYLGMMLCHLGILAVIAADALLLPVLLFYGALLGVGYALLQPLRDRLLPLLVERRSSHTVQHGVVIVSMCVYTCQALGVAVAGQMDRLGLSQVLLLQGVCLLAAALLCRPILRGLPAAVAAPATAAGHSPEPGIGRGLRYIRRQRVLRHLILLVAFNGFTHLGVYLVAMPLLVRDVYAGDAAFFSVLQLLFVVGSIVSAVALLRRGTVEQPGRSLLFCLLYSGLIMLALAARPTATGLALLVFAWGVVAGVSTNMGKALLQQQVADEFRGRVLSLYFLALLGSAPLGALACGYLMHWHGSQFLFLLSGSVSLLLFAAYLRSTALWRVPQH